MKKILFIAVLLVGHIAIGQKFPTGIVTGPMTTTQINAISSPQEGRLIGNSTTETVWYYNGTSWVDTGQGITDGDKGDITVSGSTWTIDNAVVTEAKLNTSVNASLDLADSALQSGDNVSELVNDAYVALTGNQTVDDNKTFADGVILNSSLGASNDETYLLFKNAGATNLQVGGSTGFSSIYFQDDGTLSISRNTVLTGVDHARFAFEDLTGVRTYTFPDASGTIALTSDVTGISNLVEDTTPQLGGDLDAQSRNITSVLGYTGTGLMDIGALGFTFGVNNGVSGQRWNVDTNVSNDIIFNFQSTPTTSNTTYDATPYTLNSTGTPSAATDLIDKAYADANYGGGGSSPPFDDNSPHIRDNLDNTKTITIVADNIATATNRNLTMPDADVDLGGLGPSNLDLTANYTWTGDQRFDGHAKFLNATPLSTTSGYSRFGFDLSGRAYFQKTGTTNDLFLDLSAITADRVVTVPDSDITLGGTDDQTAGEVNIVDAAGYYTGTDVEAMGQEIGSDLADRPTSLGTGRTNAVQYSDVFGQTLADYNTDGAGGAGDLIFITDASPAEVVATATIAMDGWKMYDDQTADAATITLSDCDPGETLTVYINRASAPTLAGTGLTFNPLPNTTAFTASIPMMIILEVAYDGTTIDYYYVER